MSSAIDGCIEPGFERVREAFARNFSEHGDVGAGFTLYVEGRRVADLWGGLAEPATKRPYSEDTLQLVFSTTKGATALCANILAQEGLLDVDAPVAAYWPEFAQAGKEEIPVRWLLCHKAGLPTVDKRLSYEEVLDWEPLVEALEVQSPLWGPGTKHGYHAVTFGHLVGEVVRRISGKRLGALFSERVAQPFDLEFWIGLPEEYEERVSPLIGTLVPTGETDPSLRELIDQFVGPNTLLGRALTVNGALGDPRCFNRQDLHAAELPAANGITNARSLARMYAGVVSVLDDGPAEPLLTATQIDAAREVQTQGSDACLMLFETTFGLGFFTSSPFAPYGSKGSFGHGGAGGSVGFADPENRVGFGYVMNKMEQNLSGDPRTLGLVRAAYDAIGVAPDFV